MELGDEVLAAWVAGGGEAGEDFEGTSAGGGLVAAGQFPGDDRLGVASPQPKQFVGALPPSSNTLLSETPVPHPTPTRSADNSKGDDRALETSASSESRRRITSINAWRSMGLDA